MSSPYHFGARSTKHLKACHADLQIILKAVIPYFDLTILASFRDEETQNRLQEKGLSQLRYPFSKHNQKPSMAVDIAPYDRQASEGVDWDNREAFAYLGGVMRAAAVMLKKNGQIKHELVWGGDWNSDGRVSDEVFRDLVHFELR